MAHHRLYQTRHWRALRTAQLRAHPLCCFCQAQGRTTAANTVDHVEPHRGDAALFHDPANLQSLCAPCHSKAKQQIEQRGYHRNVGHDGWPTDPRHPVNRV